MKNYFICLALLFFCSTQLKAQLRASEEPFDVLNGKWENTTYTSSIIKANNSGGINFTNVPGAYNDIRIFQKLGFEMPNSFAVGFYFTVKQVSSTGAALLPVVFTSSNLPPSNPHNQPAVQTNQNALGVLFTTPHRDNKKLQICPYIKNGNMPITELYSKFISIEYNQSYFVQLNRCNGTQGNILVKLKNKIVGSIDFTIPANMGPLNYVQAANLVQANQYRNCTAVATLFSYNPEKNMQCSTTANPSPAPIEQPIPSINTGGIVDYEDMTSRPIDKLGPGCCQLMQVQYGDYKNGYVTEGAKRYNALVAADCSDVLSINRSIVFPGRRTIVYSDNTNKQNTLFIPDTGIIDFKIYKNKTLTNTINFQYQRRFSHSLTEEFTQITNGKTIPLLTNKYVYNKPLDDFPLYCISYKDGDSSKYLKINYFGKKRNINSFTVFNSETNSTVNYTVLRDKNKYTRFWRFSPLHYYVGLQTPEKPDAILNVFAFAGDLITDLIPDKEIDGSTKIHFDYTFVKNTNSHLTSMRGSNGTNIVFDYDCNYNKADKITPPPPPKKEEPKDITPVDPPKDDIKKPKNVMDPKEMKDPKKNGEVKKPISKDSIPTPIVPVKGKG
jgi:hypothetical protein